MHTAHFVSKSSRMHTVTGVPMVCLPIWHWYMLRGDWLKSEKGVKFATSESMLLESSSACVKRRPRVPPPLPSGHLHPPWTFLGTWSTAACHMTMY